LNFIFGIVCLFVCVCAFSLRRESPDMILGDKPLIFEVVLSHQRSNNKLQYPIHSYIIISQHHHSRLNNFKIHFVKNEF
jgi:hypothetical protein